MSIVLLRAHRHPSPTVTSLCALVQAMHHNYYEKDGYSPTYTGQKLTAVAGKTLLNVQNDIKQANVTCADVLFENLTADAVSVVKSVYAQFNWEYTAEYDTILKNYLEENRKQREETKRKLEKKNKALKGEKDKLHNYKPEDFGLTKNQLSEGPFATYINRYNIKSDK